MGRGDDYYEDSYSDDPVQRESSEKSRFAPLLLVVALVLSGFALRTVYAANISINSEANLEFGQGIVTTAACSGNNNITVTPRNSFDNDVSGGSFKLSSVRVSGIPAGCSGQMLSFSAYNSSDANPLSLFAGTESVLDVTPTGSTFVTGNSGVSLSDLSSSAFTATFSSPVALSTSVSKITVQSSKDSDYANRGSITLGGAESLEFSSIPAFGTSAYTIEMFMKLTGSVTANSLIVSGSSSPGIYINSDRNQITIMVWGPGSGSQVFYISPLSMDVWHHFVVVRGAGNKSQLFIDGSKSINAAITDGNNYTGGISGAFTDGAGSKLQGQISNLRLTTTAVYDPNATTIPVPTAPLKVVSGTTLLLKTSTDNPFGDSSSSPKTVTRNGTITSSSNSPF